jgi:hypothetical protein
VFQAALHWLMRLLNATGAGLWFVLTGAWGNGTMGTWVYILAAGFVVALVAVPAVFKWLKLAQAAEAMGLPDGSVRAIIALTLVFLFAVLPIYLFDRVAGHGGMAAPIVGLSEDAKRAATTQYAADDPIFVQVTDPKNADKYTYTMYFREPYDQTATDFAKQMLVLLGTLATSVASFYFGSNTATTAATAATHATAAATQAAQNSGLPPKPVPSGLKTTPSPVTRANNVDVEFTLDVLGTNMNNVDSIRIQSGSTETQTFSATSDAVHATCTVTWKQLTVAPGAAWDVIVIDTAGQESTPLKGELSF